MTLSLVITAQELQQMVKENVTSTTDQPFESKPYSVNKVIHERAS